MIWKLEPARMFRRIIISSAAPALLITVMILPQPATAGVSVDCEGSARAYAAQGIPCYCKGGRIVCDSPSGGKSSGGSSKKGLSNKNQMKLNMLQGAMDDFANSFIRWVNAPATPVQQGPTPEQIAAQHQQQELAKAEWRAKMQQQINEMESQYEQQKKQELENKKKRVLSGMKGLDSAAPGSQSPALQQLICSAYWSKKAAQATLDRDENKAREFSRFAEKPDAASMAECARVIPEPPVPSSGDEFRSELYQTMIEEINLRLPLIEQAREKQKQAVGLAAEKQSRVDALKSRQTVNGSAGEKQADDDLLAAAMQELAAANVLKNEADVGVMKIKLELEALNEMGSMVAKQ